MNPPGACPTYCCVAIHCNRACSLSCFGGHPHGSAASHGLLDAVALSGLRPLIYSGQKRVRVSISAGSLCGYDPSFESSA